MVFIRKTLSHGAVACGDNAVAQAAAEVMDQGGNAFDAAFAAILTSTLVEPVFSSPGGGGLATLRTKDGKTSTIDFFVDLPGSLNRDADIQEVHADFGTVRQAFHIGAGTTAVPGMEAGLGELFKLSNNRMPTEKLCSIALQNGNNYKLTTFQARLFEIVEPILRATPDAEDLFAPNGTLLKAGDTYLNSALRTALQPIADNGMKSLYGLFNGRQTFEFLRENGAHLSLEDIADYSAEVRAPVSLTNKTVAPNAHIRAFAAPSPSLGGTLTLSMYSCMRDPQTPAGRLAAIAEVDRLWRNGTSEPEFCVKYGLKGGSHEQQPAASAFRGTTHISIIDPYRNAIAITLTNGEGNGLMVPDMGFMMNNMLGELDVNPAGPKGWQPSPIGSRRLASMMAPMIVEDPNDGLLIMGSGGSNRIRTALFQVLANRCAMGMGLKEAIELPRIHYEDGKIDVECSEAQDGVNDILGMAQANLHKVTMWDECNMYFGGVNAVESHFFGSGKNHAWGDSRRGGAAIVLD